jgi:hypothetical protein
LNAVADEGAIETELITGLGIEADTTAERGADTTGELQPRRLFDQRHRVATKQRRRPVSPQIGDDVSHAMGNTIATSNMLFATYNPVNLASVRKVYKAAAAIRLG